MQRLPDTLPLVERTALLGTVVRWIPLSELLKLAAVLMDGRPAP